MARPIALTQYEIDAFLKRNVRHGELSTYLRLPSYRPHGIVVSESLIEGYEKEYMVWIDASERLHVLDITGNPIAAEIKKAPYVPPDSDFLRNLMKDVERITSKASSLFYVAAIVIGLVAVSHISKVFRR